MCRPASAPAPRRHGGRGKANVSLQQTKWVAGRRRRDEPNGLDGRHSGRSQSTPVLFSIATDFRSMQLVADIDAIDVAPRPSVSGSSTSTLSQPDIEVTSPRSGWMRFVISLGWMARRRA
jgi:hypothetical protein